MGKGPGFVSWHVATRAVSTSSPVSQASSMAAGSIRKGNGMAV